MNRQSDDLMAFEREGEVLYKRARAAGFTVRQSIAVVLEGEPKWAKPEMVNWWFTSLRDESLRCDSPTQIAALRRIAGVKRAMSHLKDTLE